MQAIPRLLERPEARNRIFMVDRDGDPRCARGYPGAFALNPTDVLSRSAAGLRDNRRAVAAVHRRVRVDVVSRPTAELHCINITPSPGSPMSFVTFLFAALILAITPGPGIAYVVARTVSSGRASGLASCLGTGIGGMAHVVAAALGLSVVVAQSAMAFNVVKYIGAAYLIFLGVRILMRKEAAAPMEAGPSKGVHRSLLEGVFVEVLNVKTALFFLAFLPQFASTAQPLIPQLVMLGSICVALNTAVDVVAVFAAQRLLDSGPARAARARWLTRFSGGTMVGLGIFLGLARRES